MPNLSRAETLQSVYTDLVPKSCKYLEGSKESDSSVQLCSGIAGYHLLHLEGDLRESITVKDPQGKEYPLEYWSTIAGGFSYLGDKAEWRVEKSGAKIVPKALIVRVNVSENSEKPDVKTSYLAVAKIVPGKACVIAKIPPGPNMNQLARDAADSAAEKPCLGDTSAK
ncbi:MAG: hypothetical protein K8R69_04815 [Deltaproteobacteria bacterium]|nr:hypothetical protein [Deltaproteobacteria bacterium]